MYNGCLLYTSGPAQSWCKENGKPLEFDSKADAENYAKEANEHTTANVRYYVDVYKRQMLYGDVPTFETVIAAVRELEKEINTL